MHVRQRPVSATCAHLQTDHIQFTPQVPAPMPAAKRRKGPNGRKSSYYDDDDDDDDMPRKGRRSQSKVGPTPASLYLSPFASPDTQSADLDGLSTDARSGISMQVFKWLSMCLKIAGRPKIYTEDEFVPASQRGMRCKWDKVFVGTSAGVIHG